MVEQNQADARFGEILALVVGLGLILGGVLNRVFGGAMAITTILVLIGAGALSGYVRARQKRLGAQADQDKSERDG